MEDEVSTWCWVVVGVIDREPCLMVYSEEWEAQDFMKSQALSEDTILRCFVVDGIDWVKFDVVAQKRLMWVQALVQA